MIGSLTLSIILAFSAGSVSLAPAGLPRECILRNGIYPGQHCLFFDGFESGDLTAWSLVCKGRRCKEVRRCPGGAKKPKAPLAQPKAPAVPLYLFFLFLCFDQLKKILHVISLNLPEFFV